MTEFIINRVHWFCEVLEVVSIVAFFAGITFMVEAHLEANDKPEMGLAYRKMRAAAVALFISSVIIWLKWMQWI